MFIKGRVQNACASSCLLLVVLALPAGADAQEVVTPLASESPRIDLTTVPAASNTLAAVAAPAQIATGAKRGVLVPLYVSFATLQLLDAHSTIRALGAGAHEQNPVMKGIASQPAALVAVKSGVAASTILIADKIRERSRTGAIIFMAAANSLTATVVAHNYSTLAQH